VPGAPAAGQASRQAGAAEDRVGQARLAEDRIAQARLALADAVQAEDDVKRAAERLAAQIAELSERLDAAQREARGARQTRLAAERDLASAERRLNKIITTDQ
jgi:hypothetical protein